MLLIQNCLDCIPFQQHANTALLQTWPGLSSTPEQKALRFWQKTHPIACYQNANALEHSGQSKQILRRDHKACSTPPQTSLYLATSLTSPFQKPVSPNFR